MTSIRLCAVGLPRQIKLWESACNKDPKEYSKMYERLKNLMDWDRQDCMPGFCEMSEQKETQPFNEKMVIYKYARINEKIREI